MNQIPWGKLFAGVVRAGSGLPRDTSDIAGIHRPPGPPRLGATPKCCCRQPMWPRRSRDRGSNPGQPRCRPRGRRRNGIRHRRTAAFQQRLTRWARMSGDCAVRPRDRHPWGRGQCGAGAQTPGTGGPRTPRPRSCRDARRRCGRRVGLALRACLPVSRRNAEAQSGIPPAAKSWLKPTDLGAACLRARLEKPRTRLASGFRGCKEGQGFKLKKRRTRPGHAVMVACLLLVSSKGQKPLYPAHSQSNPLSPGGRSVRAAGRSTSMRCSSIGASCSSW